MSMVQQAREARAQWDQQIMDWDTVFDRAVPLLGLVWFSGLLSDLSLVGSLS